MTEVEFILAGPFQIKYEKASGKSIITKDDAKSFWKENIDFIDAIGVYVFAIQRSNAIVPVYVGQSTNGFANEALHSEKIIKYNEYIAYYKKDYPVFLYFLYYPSTRGQTNTNAIDDLEEYLIKAAEKINPDIVNIQKREKRTWGIRGITNSQQGRPETAIVDFKTLMGLEKI
jgi:hypothetical protein